MLRGNGCSGNLSDIPISDMKLATFHALHTMLPDLHSICRVFQDIQDFLENLHAFLNKITLLDSISGDPSSSNYIIISKLNWHPWSDILKVDLRHCYLH